MKLMMQNSDIEVVVLGGGSSIPSGLVAIWSGSADTIPEGWHICDGDDGTLDLRDKFILSAGTNHAVGETGGSENVTLTVAQMPEHNHTVNSLKRIKVVKDTQTNDNEGNVGIYGPTYGQDTVTSTKTGTSQPHPNMPPYYTLCYIQKI